MCTNYDRYITDKDLQRKLKKMNAPLGIDKDITEEELEKLKQKDIRITNDIMTVKIKESKPVITIMNWSINWNPKMPIYNSRIETIKDQPRWKSIFNNSRCLIPATSFYEYRPFENDPPDVAKLKKENKVKRKTKFNISLEGEDFFFIGGIFVWNKDRNYCSMITTTPHKELQKIPHHRSPYIILPEDAMEFLEADPSYLLDNIKPLETSKKLEISQVSDL